MHVHLVQEQEAVRAMLDKEINELRQERELHESLQQQRASLRQQQSSLLEERAIVVADLSQKQLDIKQLQQSLHQEMVASAALRDQVHEQGAARGAAAVTRGGCPARPSTRPSASLASLHYPVGIGGGPDAWGGHQPLPGPAPQTPREGLS